MVVRNSKLRSEIRDLLITSLDFRFWHKLRKGRMGRGAQLGAIKTIGNRKMFFLCGGIIEFAGEIKKF